MRTGPYTCTLPGCGKRVNGSERVHLQMQHTPKTTAFVCTACNHADTILDGMYGHLRSFHKMEVTKGFAATLEVNTGVVYEKLLVCLCCTNFRHWLREAVDEHTAIMHPDVAVQGRRLRGEGDGSIAQMTAQLLALRTSTQANTEARVKTESKDSLADSIRAVLATAPSQSPPLQLSEAQKDRAYDEASAAADNARPVFIVPKVAPYSLAMNPRKMVCRVVNESKDAGTQVVMNRGLFTGLTHDCVLTTELLTEISGQTIWCATVYFDCDLPIHRLLYFGLKVDEPMAQFYLNPHPGGRLLSHRLSDPSIDPFSEYRGAVIKTNGVFEHVYIFASRVEPTVGVWRVWSGKTLMGKATVTNNRMPLFMLGT